MMTEAFGGRGIENTPQRKQDGIETARPQGIRYGKRHRPAPRDHANRR
jgi:hypothetical protein